MDYKEYQLDLFEKIKHSFKDQIIPKEIKKSFFNNPRHLFFKQYRTWEQKKWIKLNKSNTNKYLPKLYENTTLPLIGNNGIAPSTISEPSLVLLMLQMLNLKKGHKVFELGAGSGWNAALISNIVGEKGHVYSIEIIPEIGKLASENIKKLKITNATIVSTDGGDCYEEESPYDRMIFTAGTYDIPYSFYKQLKNNGLLLAIIKIKGGGDNLFLLKKKKDYLEAIDSLPCEFVPLTGKYQVKNMEPIWINQIKNWNELKKNIVSKKIFWWGGKKNNGLTWGTMAFRSYLSITEPNFIALKYVNHKIPLFNQIHFGIYLKNENSLAVFKDHNIICYGNNKAKNKIYEHLNEWVKTGMPSSTCFKLKIYPDKIKIKTQNNQWLIKGKYSQFLWELKND